MPEPALPEGMVPVAEGDHLIDNLEGRGIVVEGIELVLDDANRVASRTIKAVYPPEHPAHEHTIVEGGEDGLVVGNPGDESFRYWWHGRS